MNDFDNRKDLRRKKINSKNIKKFDLSDEDKFLYKSKKHIKKKKEEMRQEELWEDWDNNYDNR